MKWRGLAASCVITWDTAILHHTCTTPALLSVRGNVPKTGSWFRFARNIIKGNLGYTVWA